MSANELKPIKEGKVREIYDNGDSLIMVATDRISCFDVILNNEVTKKGTVLTQMSKFWFDLTEDILPNHMITVDVNEMPEFFRQPKFDGNSMMCKKLEMLPIECIVRGYITGSGWASYKENGTVCGIKLPEGLKESDKLPEPIYTPSTKAEIGDHDENISYEQSIEVLEKQFPGKGEEYAKKFTFNIGSQENWFEELKVIGAELGYCANRKEYKANPDQYKGMISDVAGAVRSALSHRTNTPDLYTIMQIMGEDKVRERFNRFLEL